MIPYSEMPGRSLLLAALWTALAAAQKPDLYHSPIRVPRLERTVTIDGNVDEWKRYAHSDGLWDIERLRHTPWFDPARNRLTLHRSEGPPEDDLAARYYIAWDDRYFYLGAEVSDNVNDHADPAHEPKRWYYKDAICWFIEAPRGNAAKQFGQADHAFCFVIDPSRPGYGAWWRHGAPGRTYIEEPLPKHDAEYALKMTAPGRGDFVLEARVAMKPTLGRGNPEWRAPRTGDIYGLEIVHTDPDGGAYGGHFLIYGRGDDDATWGWLELTGPTSPIERKPN